MVASYTDRRLDLLSTSVIEDFLVGVNAQFTPMIDAAAERFDNGSDRI